MQVGNKSSSICVGTTLRAREQDPSQLLYHEEKWIIVEVERKRTDIIPNTSRTPTVVTSCSTLRKQEKQEKQLIEAKPGIRGEAEKSTQCQRENAIRS